MTEQNQDSIDNPTNEVAMLTERYNRLMHAMQTGVEYTREIEPSQVDPKHMRVGVNSSLVSMGALCKLLIDKGVLTEVEYWRALVGAMETEVETYETRLREHLGHSVSLG